MIEIKDPTDYSRYSTAYFIKPPTKYPLRVYLFYAWEMWNPRNLRPMGLYGKSPIFTRPMFADEIFKTQHSWRMVYWQIEYLDELVDYHKFNDQDDSPRDPKCFEYVQKVLDELEWQDYKLPSIQQGVQQKLF